MIVYIFRHNNRLILKIENKTCLSQYVVCGSLKMIVINVWVCVEFFLTPVCMGVWTPVAEGASTLHLAHVVYFVEENFCVFAYTSHYITQL